MGTSSCKNLCGGKNENELNYQELNNANQINNNNLINTHLLYNKNYNNFTKKFEAKLHSFGLGRGIRYSRMCGWYR